VKIASYRNSQNIYDIITDQSNSITLLLSLYLPAQAKPLALADYSQPVLFGQVS